MSSTKRKDQAAPKPPETEEALSPELAAHFYTRPEIIDILKVHADTLARWRARGIAPPQTVLPGRRIVFSKSSFQQWLQEREQPTRKARRTAHA